MGKVALLAAGVVTIACAAAVGSATTITVYTDKTEWEDALGAQHLTEDFADALLNVGVSYVSSESGHINPEQECYQDVLASQSQNEPMTIWTFEPRIAAYGGNWTLGGPGGSGNSLLVYIEDESLYVGYIPNSYNGGFWGFISDTPFSSVRLVGGGGTNQQHYCLDDMVYWHSGVTGVEREPVLDGAGPALSLRSAPNPTTGSTALLLQSAASLQDVHVSVYDVVGREVMRFSVGDLSSGARQVLWDGRDTNGRQVVSGVYHCVAAHSGGGSNVVRLVVLR